MDRYTPLKKALHRAIAQAYKSGNKMVAKAINGMPNKEHALNHIMADLNDSNDKAQVPESHITAGSESVLNKDQDPQKEMNQNLKGIQHQKEQNAKAQLGQLEAQPPQNTVNMNEPTKGVHKLQKFMNDRIAKAETKVYDGKKGADKAVEGAKQPDHPSNAFNQPKKTVQDLIKEKEATKSKSINLTKANKFESKTGFKGQDTAQAKKMIRASNPANAPQTGVHESKYGSAGSGKSVAGTFATSSKAHADAGRNINSMQDSAKARSIHREKLSDIKSQPKPNLPKSESMNKSSDESNMKTLKNAIDSGHKVTYEHHVGEKNKGGVPHWYSVEIHDKDGLRAGFGHRSVTPAIALAKEHAKKQKSVQPKAMNKSQTCKCGKCSKCKSAK